MTEKASNYLMINGKYFSDNDLFTVKKHLELMDDSQIDSLTLVTYKDPIWAIIFSLLFGSLGIDRFYIGDMGLGIAKLLTCGGFGIWTIVDWFLIMGKAKEKNFTNFITRS